MTRKTLLAIAAALALIILLGPGTVQAVTTAGVYSWLIPGASNTDKTCAAIQPNFAHPDTVWTEFKIDGNPGSGTYGDGYIEVTITRTGNFFDWVANIPVDAIVVKDGVDGANVYVYNGYRSPADGTTYPHPGGTWSTQSLSADGNLSTPFDGDKGISHISFCYGYSLAAEKSAHAEYTRTYTWEIEKSVDPASHTGWFGDSFTSDYEVTVTPTIVDSAFKVTGLITITNPTPHTVVFEVADSVNGTPAEVTCPAYTLMPGASVTCSYVAALGDTLPPDGTNTATVTSLTANVSGAVATADYAFGAPTTIVGYPTVNVEDEFDGETETLGAASAARTFEYDRDFECPTDEGLYEDGVYTASFPNTATIVETGQYDQANVDLTCYIPLVEKSADTEWFREYDWDITKEVYPASHSGFIGDGFTSTYTVTVIQSVDDYGFRAFGYIYVTNPGEEPITVTVTDAVDGTAATVDCDGSDELTVLAGETASCSYTVDLPDGTSLTNTATVAFNGHHFTATADVIFGDPEIIGEEEVNVTDYFDGDLEGEALGAASMTETFVYTRTFECETDRSLYSDGAYTRAFPNTAEIDETGDSDDANVDLACYMPLVRKDAETEWFKKYEWEITKEVYPAAHTGLQGDTFTSHYTVTVAQTVTNYGYRAFGKIWVSNPGDAPITVMVADAVNGTAATVDCGDGTATLTVPAGMEKWCSYTVNLPDGTSLTNTATVTFNNETFTATAAVVFGDPTIQGYPTINVTDYFDGDDVGVALGSASATKTFTFDQGFECPTENDVYQEGYFHRLFPNTAKINETGQSDDAEVSLTCKQYASKGGYKWRDINNNGIYEEWLGETKLSMWTMELYEWADGGWVHVKTTKTGADGHYRFYQLVPGATYLVCEVLEPGWYQTFPYEGASIPEGESLVNCQDLFGAEYGTWGYKFTPDPGQSLKNNNFGNNDIVGCTYTLGYWKTHSEYGPAPYDATWAKLEDGADTLFFGTGKSWYEIFWTAPAGGNAYIILAHQYMAAYLNGLQDEPASLASVAEEMVQAAGLLETYATTAHPRFGAPYIPDGPDRDLAIQLAYTLDLFNNGLLEGGPPHCDEAY